MRLQTLALLVLAGAASAAAQEAPSEVDWCGTDLLVTGAVSSDLKMSVRGLHDEVPTLHGVWPDINLFGVYDGEMVNALPCAAGRLCLQFDGVLHSLEAAGFPAGTEAPMVVSLDMAEDGSSARGVYKVGLFPGGYPAEQYGILELGACEVS